MIAAPPTALCPSQFFGVGMTARPLSSRRPSLIPRRVTAAYYSAPAADLLSPLLTPPTPSLYEVLGIATEATPQEIKTAYRRLARTCHPDTIAGGSGGASADEFMKIHAAYATLSDPDTRADYNRKLMVIRRQRRPASAYSTAKAAPFAGGYSRRSWETDQCW